MADQRDEPGMGEKIKGTAKEAAGKVSGEKSESARRDQLIPTC